MKKSFFFILPAILFAQEKQQFQQSGKYDTNKFSQMYDLLATPNMFRNALVLLVQLIINNKQIIKSTSS
jgi:hypothetical protein